MLVKGVDNYKQLTSTGVLLLKYDYTNILMARAGGNKVFWYSQCANKLVSTNVFDRHHRILRKEVMVFCSTTSELASKDSEKNLRNRCNIVEASSNVTNILKLVPSLQHMHPKLPSPSSSSSREKQTRKTDESQFLSSLLAMEVARERKLEAVRLTKPRTHKDITKFVKEIKIMLMKGIDTRK